jgi:hypothetical protein
MARSNRNFGALVLLLLFVILVLGVATVVLTANKKNDPSDPDPPAPAPATGATCDWCGDLLDRVDTNGATAVKRRAEPCKTLMQSDFDAGTFVADVADACYVLGEDIVFHPAPHNDFRATKEPYASDPAFILDFPAAILVRAAGVSIDLGGHEIRQSRLHHVQQRFFAVIELTTPFISGQGPADFVQGTEPVPASMFTLRNGRIGLSSHHGVHGNGAWTILIEDVDISDYEVGAVALNGVHDVVLRRVRALGTLDKVPVLATYSSARFLMPFVKRALGAARASSSTVVRSSAAQLSSASTRLQQLMDEVAEDVDSAGAVDKNRHGEAYALFGDPTGLPDGSASYGFIIHAHGVAVNGFECDHTDARHDQLHHVLIADCEVRNTLLHAVEVPVLQEVASQKLQRGPAGDVLRVADLVNGEAYAGTALSDTKIALQELVLALGSSGFGTLAVHPTVMRWARGDSSALSTAVGAGAFRYMRNGDNMFHVNKGAFGIRVGGGHHIAVRRTAIAGVDSTGNPANFDPLPGETVDDAYWTGGTDGGHPAADPQHGYGGADSVGIAVAAAADVILDAVTIRNVHSRAGWASGLFVFNGATDVRVNDVGIFGVTAMTNPDLKVPGPKQPRAVGVSITTDATPPIYTGTLDIQDIKAGRIGMACNELVDNTGIDGCAAPETNFYSL